MSPRTEQELLDQTVELAMRYRWAVAHFRPARTCTGWRTAIQGHIGFPDLVLARRGVTLLRELKGPKGRLSSEQLDWAREILPGWAEGAYPLTDEFSRMKRTDMRFDVWRPCDFEWLVIPTLTVGEML